MKKKLLSAVLAAVLMASAGIFSTNVAAASAAQTWSVAVHLEYANGDTYDIVIAREVSTEKMASMLADCGRSHRTGTVVRYHCYPIPE